MKTLTETLRQILLCIYGEPIKPYLIQLGKDEYVPTIRSTGNLEGVSSWIGYRILSYKPYVQTYPYPSPGQCAVEVTFRLTFIGKQGEEWAQQTLFWPIRPDVKKITESRGFQLYDFTGEIKSVPVVEGGYSDQLAWSVDMKMSGFIDTGATYKHWFTEKISTSLKGSSEDPSIKIIINDLTT